MSGRVDLREAVESGDFDDEKDGLGRFLSIAADLRAVASMAVGFFAVHRSSEIDQLATFDVVEHDSDAAANIGVAQQQNGQLGVDSS